MSKSPNVLVAVGTSQKGHIPQQTYKNIFTQYNMGSFPESDVDFFNAMSHEKVLIKGTSDFDIYGFMPGNCKYTYDYSIQNIVDFFEQNEKIEIVICDMLNITEHFEDYLYTYPYSPTNNIPFFIRKSIKDKVNFIKDQPIFQSVLNKFQQERHPIFHIAKPLISILNKGNE